MGSSLDFQLIFGSRFNSCVSLTPQEGAVIADMKSILQILQEIQKAGGSDISPTSARELCIYIQKLYQDLNAIQSPVSPNDQHMITTAKELFEGYYLPYNLEQAASLYNPLDPNDVLPMQEAMKTFITSRWLPEEIANMQDFINNPFKPPV